MTGLTRKPVTILFADVVDSTPLGEGLDPESLRRVMGRYFDEMRSVIERHGGTVEKYIGDAIMAVFGIPHVHEDDALRAVRAAAEMREALSALNARLARPIAMRTGINTGEVVAGDGHGQRHTLVTGDIVNVASRLQGAARVNEILMGASTFHLVRDAVVAEPVGGLELKGKSLAVEAHRLTAVIRDAPGRLRRLDSPLVGRELELALLRQTFEKVAARGSSHLFTLVGAAGAGKSRLGQEMLAGVTEGATVLVGRCLPYGDGITFWPLREIIRKLPDVEALVGPVDAAVIAAAVGLDDDASGATEDTFGALRRLVEAIAREQPLVLVFEDVHWGEPTFLDFVEYLASRVRDASLLLLCLARPELLEARPSWAGGHLNASTILLEPLDESESERLVENLGGDELAPELRHAIAETAEGNPLFLEEMVAMAREDPRAAESMPPTINALLTARIEALPPREREVLQTASVVGRFFSGETLRAVAGDVDRELVALGQKDLVRPYLDSLRRETYRFRHVLIRDAAYDALPKEVRTDLHVRVAHWLASGDQTVTRDVDELVGYHLERAARLREELGERTDDVAAPAAAALARAGRRALFRGDAAAAQGLLQRATVLSTPVDADRVERLLDFATALQERGELVTAATVVEEALSAARSLDDERLEARALVERSYLAFYADPQRWVDEGLPAAEGAIAVLEGRGDDFGLARAWLLLLLLHYGRCHVAEMQEALQPALRYARQARDGRQVGIALNASIRALLVGPTPVDEAVEQAQAIAREPEADRALEAVACGVVACLEAMRGRFAEARAAYADSDRTLADLGRTRLRAAQRAYSGLVELLASEPEAAERELRDGVAELEKIGDRTNVATVAGLLAEALAAQGRWAEAEEAAATSERASSSADVAAQVTWRLTRARLAAHRGLADEAVERAEDAVTRARTTDSPTLLAGALVCRAEVGAADDAAEALAEAVELYELKGHVVGAARARAALAQPGGAGESPSASAAAASRDGGADGGT